MSRTQKLIQRLDLLEAEYRLLTAHEFAEYVKGGAYRHLFLAKMLPFLPSPRYSSVSARERFDEILHVEKEIEALRIKLNQPMSESPIQRVRDAATRICDAHESGEGTELMIAKTLLKDLGQEELTKHR